MGYSWGDHVGTAYTSEVNSCSQVGAQLHYISYGQPIMSNYKTGSSWADVSLTGVTGVIKGIHSGANNGGHVFHYLYKS